jgi:hypothetical protein
MFSLGVVLAEVMTGRLQRSKGASCADMANDVYYELIVTQKSITADPFAGAMDKGVMNGLGQCMVSCMSPIPGRRPTAATVAHILGEL